MSLGKLPPDLPELLEIGLRMVPGVLDAEGRVATSAALDSGVAFLRGLIEREERPERLVSRGDHRRIDTVPREIDEAELRQALPETVGKAPSGARITATVIPQIESGNRLETAQGSTGVVFEGKSEC